MIIMKQYYIIMKWYFTIPWSYSKIVTYLFILFYLFLFEPFGAPYRRTDSPQPRHPTITDLAELFGVCMQQMLLLRCYVCGNSVKQLQCLWKSVSPGTIMSNVYSCQLLLYITYVTCNISQQKL